MSKESTSSGIGLGGVLFCIFLVLKLLGKIDWSWWWVTSPLWIPIGIFLIFIIGVLIFIIGVMVVFVIRELVK